MDLTALGFSVHNFISSVGADAGFAAIIGLAVLILLYFAHARETANLREEASILAERLQQAEARVAELSRPQALAAPVPAPEGVQVTDRRGAGVAGLPFAPAGVGAPALASATRVVPLPEVPPPQEPPAPPQVPATAPAPAPVVAAPASMSPGAEKAALAPSAAPAAAAPAVAAAASRPPSMPRPATAAGANGGNGSGRGPGGLAVPASRPSRSTSPNLGSLPPLGDPARSRGGTGRRIAIGLLALLLVAAAVVALVVVTASSSGTKPARNPTATSNAPASRAATAFSPASVTVAVLNGTATNQLAHRVADKLATSGYQKGTIATAASQTQTSTVVAYLPGAKNRTDALHVATALNLKPTAVQPIDQSTQQVACPAPGSCTANVVVTVGSDLATLPGA